MKINANNFVYAPAEEVKEGQLIGFLNECADPIGTVVEIQYGYYTTAEHTFCSPVKPDYMDRHCVALGIKRPLFHSSDKLSFPYRLYKSPIELKVDIDYFYMAPDSIIKIWPYEEVLD